jgi:diguanylate cyclase (GGDEF)-like protein
VRDAITSTRHFQGQVNVAKLLEDPELEARILNSLADAEGELQKSLDRVAQFDPQSAAIVMRERQLSLSTMQKSMVSLMEKTADALPLAIKTIQHLDAIESTLKNAGERERQRADAISKRQLDRARSAVKLSVAIVVAAVLLGVTFSLLILRSITRPLQSTVAVLRQINAGETLVDMPPISPDEFGDMAMALRQFRDQAERLRHLAYTDELSGLGNRAHFDEALRAAVAEAEHARRSLALLYIDIDNFSAVNDSLGHSAGDRYLREAAQRLHQFAFLESHVWRYSGDKFTLLLEGPAEGGVEALRERATAQATLVLKGLSEPMLLQGHWLPMSA